MFDMIGLLRFTLPYPIIGFLCYVLLHRFTEVIPELPQSGWRQKASTIGSALYCVYLVRMRTSPFSCSHFRVSIYLANIVKLALVGMSWYVIPGCVTGCLCCAGYYVCMAAYVNAYQSRADICSVQSWNAGYHRFIWMIYYAFSLWYL